MEKKKYEKEFVIRNSLLTDLLENEHLRTIYNAFLQIFLGLFIYTCIYEYVENKHFNLGLKLIRVGFGKFHLVILGWSILFLLACLIFFSFKLWIKLRNFNKKFDWFALIFIALYYFYSFKLAELLVTTWKLPIASSLIITIEHVRIIMKIHSFLRTNCSKVLNNEAIFPEFSNFLYFMFAPTYLYRDSYPRRAKINWVFARNCLLELFGAIYFLSFVWQQLLHSQIENFCVRKYQPKELILILFRNVMIGALILLPMFYIILHCCQNFFGEILRFGDRFFYSDWWTVTDLGAWFRKWNIIVQEWLFLYIYLDFKKILKMNDSIAKLAIFVISALVHEWILVCSFGFFFPLLTIEFLFFGVPLSKIRFFKHPTFNAIILYMIFFGTGSLITLYTIEYYAKNNSPNENSTFWENITPRMITGNCIA